MVRGSGSSNFVNRYFELSVQIESAKSAGDFHGAIQAARETYALLPRVVKQWKEDHGSFDIVTSHAVHTAPTLMAVLEDSEGIRQLRTVLEGVEELRVWLPLAEQAESDRELVPQILAAVTAEPGILQSSLKATLNLTSGSRLAQLVAWMDKGRRVYRVKKGSSNRIYPSGYIIAGTGSDAAREFTRSNARPTPTIRRRASRNPARARLLDFDALKVVRLPMAPPHWEERAAYDNFTAKQKAAETFSDKSDISEKFVVDGVGWAIVSQQKLTPAERPDLAFKKVFHTAQNTHWLDPKGKREGFEYAPSILRVTDRMGRPTAERGLPYDVYRADVNPNGTGILFLSREGILHGYTETLEPLMAEFVSELPEYAAQADRFGIGDHDLKNHVRCVAVSPDCSRYLITVVDEAWCLETKSGEVLWGFRMPTKEGWTRRVADRSGLAGTSAEVDEALRVMELDLPIGPDDVTRQYRKLAMRWHPDRNPADPTATDRFQLLGAAMELLTGADLSQLTGLESERVTYEQVLSKSRHSTNVTDDQGRPHVVDLDISFSMIVGEAFASDWIYAANIGKDGRAYLAAYSGKVVVVSPSGIPERVYDIGAVPRQIIDAGEHLYILTDTRLYVLSGEHLDGLVDVFEAGDLLVGDNGFALLQQKSFTWFSPTGNRLGSVRTKDPLRRVFCSATGVIIETRQHRAVVVGAPSWWV